MATTLEVILQARDHFTATAQKVMGSMGKLETAAGRVGKAAGVVAAGAVTASALVIAKSIRTGITSLEALEEANAQTAAVITSTGGVAGQTAADIRRMSEAFEDMNALFDDKVVQSGANVLLTFTDIRKEAFEPALEAALDLSVAMKQDLQTSVEQIGKALNDPTRNLGALTRAGVIFTDQQRDQIKALVKSGDTLGAQRVILAELNKEFGGSFLAQGQTSRAKMAGFFDAIEDLQMTLAEGLLPAVVNVAGALKVALSNPQLKADIAELGRSLGSILTPANVTALVGAAQTIGDVVKTAVGLFTSLPPDLQKLAIAALAVNKLTGGGLTSLVGLALSGLKTIMAPHVTVIGGTVTGPGAMPPAPGTPPTGPGGGGVGPRIGAAAVITPEIWQKYFSPSNPESGINRLLDRIHGTAGGTNPLLTSLQQQEHLLRENGESTDQVRAAIRAMPTPVVNVSVNVTARDVDTAVRSSTSYGPTASSYYGGSTAPAYSH